MTIGYAWGQLARAIAAGHAGKIEKWRAVLAGMQDGTLAIGARTPTAAPAWVTLDVATGGFATGGYAAGGPLRDWESALAAELGVPATRRALNVHAATAPDTLERFTRGTYRIDLPEEAALLVVAWLRARNEVSRAAAIVDAIAPWFDELRFYPRPHPAPFEPRETVRVQDVARTLAGLATDRRQPRVDAQRAAILVWRPLYRRALALAAEGLSERGGDWPTRVAALRADVARAEPAPTRRARDTQALVDQLARLDALAPRERGLLRARIARTTENATRDAADQRLATAPLHRELRADLVARLRALPGDAGITDLAGALAPTAHGPLPAYLASKVARSWEAPLADLVERGVVPSGEVLARVLPDVTSHVRARAIDDAAVRRLYIALYAAFRRRRGLLLIGYHHQVRFAELPWAAALEAARSPSPAAIERAREVVAATASLAIRAFPQQITPNKLVTELSALASAATLDLPLVEELAADIFMGAFTAKFVLAAKATARVLAGSLYERYYAIDTRALALLPVPSTKADDPAERRISHELAALCERRATAQTGSGGSLAARNGTVIEQAQIVTTHNLAVLFDALPLRAELAPHLRAAADACFVFVLRCLDRRSPSFHARLLAVKNAAYAWRQMVFYLSFVADVPAFLAGARTALARRDAAFRARFAPALRGLELAAEGIASDQPAFAMSGARVFTGWTRERHWLVP